MKSLGVSRSGYRAFLARKVSPTRLFLNAPLEILSLMRIISPIIYEEKNRPLVLCQDLVQNKMRGSAS